MKKVHVISLFLIAAASLALAQENEVVFSVEVSSDSVLIGNYMEVTFTLENGEAENFSPPAFDGFSLLGGPNISSSFSMFNGTVTQKISYSFYLEPLTTGSLMIGAASIESEGVVYTSRTVEIAVLANPEGIIEVPAEREQGFEMKLDDLTGLDKKVKPRSGPKKKKKRKTYIL